MGGDQRLNEPKHISSHHVKQIIQEMDELFPMQEGVSMPVLEREG